MINFIVSGACGKMGSRILALAKEDFDFRIVGALEANGKPEIGKEVFSRLKITDDLDALLVKGDVLIDFTTPEATLTHLRQVVKARKAVVIGTTGFTDQQMEEIHEASDVIPILLSPNMSVGVNQFFEIIRDVTKKIGREYKIEITETHHVHKKDAPSGTAKKLAEIIAEALKGKPAQIPTRSIREGEVVGIHTVTFTGSQERIELTHTADSRDTFALGALRAAKFIVGQPPGLYNMQDVLNQKS
jgi:4-hydroxy-tetrahydrodipicolinate reductase